MYLLQRQPSRIDLSVDYLFRKFPENSHKNIHDGIFCEAAGYQLHQIWTAPWMFFFLGIFPNYPEKLFFITPPGCYLFLDYSSN